jgi:sterol 14-demethylase
MTVRLATCRELAEDKEAVTQLAGYYWNLEKSTTPISVLLPWFPSPAKKAKAKATMGLYTLLSSYVRLRRDASTPTMDPIDHLIGEGLSDGDIIAVCLRFSQICIDTT